MAEEKLEEIRLLVESIQSGLVELFDELTELRKGLELSEDHSSEPGPRVLPLFSEISTFSTTSVEDSGTDTHADTDSSSEGKEEATGDTPIGVQSSETTEAPKEAASAQAKLNLVLNPIVLELKKGEANAEVVSGFLQTAKDYLIDDDSRKEKVARDIDVVLRFLKARGKRAINDDERDNILKRMERWKAHLVAYASSPAA